MKQFDAEKWNAWVKEQGGWKAVLQLAYKNPLSGNIFENVERWEHFDEDRPVNDLDPLRYHEEACLFACLSLNIDDFLKAETVDARTAWNILACGGVLKTLLGGCDPVDHYLKLYEEDGESVKIVWSLNHNFENTSRMCFELHVQDYEVIDWGEYKHDK